jgi:peptidoglycan/xylan/chitin deacetylase (PgdA/CDA1 family)
MNELFVQNTPENFWQCTTQFPEEVWLEAIRQAAPILELAEPWQTVDELLAAVLGEGRFGPDHWTLSRAKQLYYDVKPLVPRFLTRYLRRLYGTPKQRAPIYWPIDDRFARFQWAVMAHVLANSGQQAVEFVNFWPQGRQMAFVLTHDIEFAAGQAFVRKVAELEEAYGFRSSFNFVPERYKVDTALVGELKERGFEVGVHGLKHDGKLFRSRPIFEERAERINHYLRSYGASGFRSPLTHRQPEWMQSLAVEYDLSFFDTDQFEPIAGGTLSIWPFQLGHFVELPYTLVQDNVLTQIVGASTAQIWLDKVTFIERYCGMALVNSHPDYLSAPGTWRVYEELLAAMQKRQGVWHALPRDVARWWRMRSASALTMPAEATLGHIELAGDEIKLEATQGAMTRLELAVPAD